MKILLIASLFSALIITLPVKSAALAANYRIVNSQPDQLSNYTVREFINGKWYFVTYDADGYIVNIVEDDE